MNTFLTADSPKDRREIYLSARLLQVAISGKGRQFFHNCRLSPRRLTTRKINFKRIFHFSLNDSVWRSILKPDITLPVISFEADEFSPRRGIGEEYREYLSILIHRSTSKPIMMSQQPRKFNLWGDTRRIVLTRVYLYNVTFFCKFTLAWTQLQRLSLSFLLLLSIVYFCTLMSTNPNPNQCNMHKIWLYERISLI